MVDGLAARTLSVVIPAFGEEECLPLLVEELVPVLERIGWPYEVLLVDDGSSDGTPAAIQAICARQPAFRGLLLERRRGQSAALAAGFRAARGEVVVTLDADMQNDPADIPRVLEPIGEYDCVCGWRTKRQDTWLRRASSRIANAVRNRLTGDLVRDVGCSMRACRTAWLRRVCLFNGAHRFLPTLLKMEGARVTEVPVGHRPRPKGQSKYGVWNRLFRGLRDLFGVRWLASRALAYRVARDTGGGLPLLAPPPTTPSPPPGPPAS